MTFDSGLTKIIYELQIAYNISLVLLNQINWEQLENIFQFVLVYFQQHAIL